MGVTNVLFVHGYSETSLSAYHSFPLLLSQAGLNVQPILLSAFDSLDDQITITDLASALEDRVSSLEANPDIHWDTDNSAIICHSTGALVSRRWMLDRVLRGSKPIPSHLITMAGANHGSSLAQAGKSVLGYMQKLLTKHIPTVGAKVLTDLDYGSDFLLDLNRAWLTAWNDQENRLSSRFIFSMGGDSLGTDPMVKFFWGSSEQGTDNTVRISGANLNFTNVTVDVTGPEPVINVESTRPSPHIVLAGYSHYDDQTGIIAKARTADDLAFRRTLEALAVQDRAQYDALKQEWSAATQAWQDESAAGRSDNVDSTLVFSIYDRGGQPVEDCVIAFLDAAKLPDPKNPLSDPAQTIQATLSVTESKAINRHSPIHNDVQRASYSFYLNWPVWKNAEHVVHIDAASPSMRVKYEPVSYAIPPGLGSAIRPNQFTYVLLCLERNTDASYRVYNWTIQMPLDQMTWGPDRDFPDGWIA